MKQIFGLGLALLLATQGLAADPKQPAKGGKAVPDTVDSDTLSAGKYTGKLVASPGTDGVFKLQIEYQHAELKQGGQQTIKNNPQNTQMQRLYQDQQKIAQAQQHMQTARSAQEQQRAYQQLQQAMTNLQRQMTQSQMHPSQNQQSPFKIVTEHKDIEFQLADNANIRWQDLPQVYDAKGEIKKYTEEEKKQLKGKNPNLPGYEAAMTDLKAGQLVTVTQGAAPAAKPGDKAATDKDKAATDKDNAEHMKKKQVSLVVITKDAETTDLNAKGKKKNK